MTFNVINLKPPYVDEERLAQEHPHLFHYTTWEGFCGLLDSKGIWATHLRQLNDTSEFTLAARTLAKLIYRANIRELKRMIELRSRIRNSIRREFGSVDAALESDSGTLPNAILELSERMMPPHVVSFSSHREDHQTRGGILSLWRAYAAGGVALRFKTSELLSSLVRLKSEQRYHAAYLIKVTYGDADPLYQEQIAGLDGLAKTYLELSTSWLRKNPLKGLPESFTEDAMKFTVAAVSHKHPAFEDEREIRLVVAPFRQVYEDDARKEAQWVPGNLSRVLVHYADAIDAVMIGPAVDQSEIASKARAVLKSHQLDEKIEVKCSDIPFRTPRK